MNFLSDIAGTINGQSLLTNYSTTTQALVAATRTYITGSRIAVPISKLKIGSNFCWEFDVTKTAAGVATSTFDICFGTTGTSADTTRVSFVKPAGTAVADVGRIKITCIVRGPLSASGIAVGNFMLTHNLASTGHAVTPCVHASTVSSAFDVTVANLFVGICATTGASDAVTIQYMNVIAYNL